VGAEFLELSGLLAVFFSGVLIRHYHMYNISKASSTAFSHLISTLAFLSENFIYIYLGVSVIAYSDVLCWDWGWILASFGAQIVARACNTFPLCFLANCFRLKPIPFKYMVVIWFSGLRGAIAFALALNATSSKPEHAAIIRSATLFSVLFTTVVFSMLTGPLVRILGLAGVEPNRGMETEHSPLIPNARRRSIRDTWVGFDEKHLKPIFGGNPRTTDDSSPYMSIPRRERGLDLSELNDESEPNELSFVNRKSSTNPKSSSTTGEESYA
jgi:sodium/hydrogen exchanger 8